MSTWHYMKNGAQNGPATTEELRSLLATGAIGSDTLIWRPGMPTWVSANTVPEFAGSAPLPAAAQVSAPGVPAASAPSGGGGSKVLIIILCLVVGFFILVGGCVAACGYYAHHKAMQFSQSAKKNPQMALVSMAAAMNPDVQVVSKDEASGTITLRNKKTGEQKTMDLSSFSADNLKTFAESFGKRLQDAGATVTVTSTTTREQTGDSPVPPPASVPSADEDSAPKLSNAHVAALSAALKKFPAYAPAFPGASTNEVTQNSFGGMSMGVYDFTTDQKPEDVLDFYEKKVTEAGFTVATRGSDTNEFGPTGQLIATRTDPEGTFTVTAESKSHGTHGAVNFTHR